MCASSSFAISSALLLPPALGSGSRQILVTLMLSGVPRSGDRRTSEGARLALSNEPTPEANGYGVGSAARLKLRQEVANVRLDRFLREEETLADLPVDEAVGDELEDLDLARRRLLLELA
jgi:hypothetical protein